MTTRPTQALPTLKQIEAGGRHGRPCEDGYAWAVEHYNEPNALELLAEQRPDWYLWAVGSYDLPNDDKRLDACAKEAPWCALAYAADKLTPERKEWCEEHQND